MPRDGSAPYWKTLGPTTSSTGVKPTVLWRREPLRAGDVRDLDGRVRIPHRSCGEGRGRSGPHRGGPHRGRAAPGWAAPGVGRTTAGRTGVKPTVLSRRKPLRAGGAGSGRWRPVTTLLSAWVAPGGRSRPESRHRGGAQRKSIHVHITHAASPEGFPRGSTVGFTPVRPTPGAAHPRRRPPRYRPLPPTPVQPTTLRHPIRQLSCTAAAAGRNPRTKSL